jgi:monofunctional biosynthetic peptidoglycan transglycosylase
VSGTSRRSARRHRRRWLPKIVAALIIAITAWLAYEVWTWPNVAALERRAPGTTAFMRRYAEQQRAAGREARVSHTWVPYTAISPNLKRAVIVAEDVNFFSHRGFELDEVKNAVVAAIEEQQAPRGASTITQQLAKNVWLSPSRSPMRKIRESILTWQLERTLEKRRILELYLNVAQFGPGVFGAEAASRRYFGKRAADLDELEAAQLAASLPRPSSWHPGATGPGYLRHVGAVRRRMDKAHFLIRLI